MEQGLDTNHLPEGSAEGLALHTSAKVVERLPRPDETPRCQACGRVIFTPPTLVSTYWQERRVQFDRPTLCETCSPLVLEDRPTRKRFPQAQPVSVSPANIRLANLFMQPSKKRRARIAPLLVLLAIVFASVAAAYKLFPQARSLMADCFSNGSKAHKPATILWIESEPSGAEITIDGERKGQTPLAMNNLYAAEDVEIKLSRKGYKAWNGHFRGSSPAAIDAKLSRR